MFPGSRMLVGLGALLALAVPGWAIDHETRNFTVLIDNKKAGTYQMVIDRAEDGTLTMTGTADVNINYIVYSYKYSFKGTETWKAGRLQRLESKSNDNGKAFAVSAEAQGDDLVVRVNGQERTVKSAAWTTTYWQLPPKKVRDQPLVYIDADTGRELKGRLLYVGSSYIKVGGLHRNASRYRLTGTVSADLWYDNKERLLRQESTEDGHRTVLEFAGQSR